MTKAVSYSDLYNKAKELRNTHKEGMRVELLEDMEGEEKRGMIKGLQGTISYVDDMAQIHTTWDNRSTLAIVYGVDSYKII